MKLLLSAMNKPPPSEQSLCSILLYQIQQKNALCLLGYEKHLLFGLNPLCPRSHTVLECVEEVLVNVLSPLGREEKLLICRVPRSADATSLRFASTIGKSAAQRWTEESVAYIARQTNNNEGLCSRRALERLRSFRKIQERK